MMAVQYFQAYTDREDGEILRTVRTGGEMTQRIVQTVQFVNMINGS